MRRNVKRTKSDAAVLGKPLVTSDDEEGEPGLDPESFNFIFWLRNPTVSGLSQLRRAIRCEDGDWMRSFLEFDGLGLLFQVLIVIN